MTIIPNKGAYVSGITPKDVQDIYCMRSYLEGLCARWATEHITDRNSCSRLEEIILLSEFHTKPENTVNAQQVTNLDGQFHAVLYEASNSKILSHTHDGFS